MKQEQIQIVEKIVKEAQKLFDIQLSKQKLLEEDEYRNLVFSELESLEDENLIRLIEQFNSADNQVVEKKKVSDQNRIKPLLALTALIAVTVVAYFGWMLGQQDETQIAQAPVQKIIPQQASNLNQAEASVETEAANEFQTLFAIHGSNTIGEKLAPALLKSYFEQQGAKDVTWQQGEVATERSLQMKLANKAWQIDLAAHGSSTAFKALNTGIAQVGMASRKIKNSEIDALKSQAGDLSKLGNEHIIALDGLAIIVNQNNHLKTITTETLSRIFSGDISNWSQLGGENAPINVYARDDNSGTYDTFKSLVLKKYGRKLVGSAERFESSSNLSERVSQDEYGIGFIGLNYIRHSKALAIADSSQTKAIYPTRFTVATEDYPLSRRLYLYTPTNSTSQIKDFANFAISDAGQKIVQELGLISQSIRVESVRESQLAPEKYNEYTQLAKRLSLNFRFNYANRDLDNKGKRDLQRLVSFVEKNPNKKIVLMGFSDSIGAKDKNVLLSLSRAKSVEQELNARGINVYAVEGFGENMPLANNDNEVGRERNRRVEVWVL